MQRYKNIEIELTIRNVGVTKSFYEAIDKALEPDDKDVIDNTSIEYNICNNQITIKIRSNRKIESIEGVINDIFRCLRSSIEILKYCDYGLTTY